MKPLTRAVHGIVLLDKPIGLTSNVALQRVKRVFRATKAGHTGSLDPLATGMLPICFGEATKLCQYGLEADKCYRVTGCLGISTDTGDAMGQVVATAAVNCSVQALTAVVASLQGVIQQVPPMVSALKHQGKPLYVYARAGIILPRAARTVTIYSSELLQFDGQLFSLSVRCSKGTYIRSLVEAIGEALGVGAHVTQLHREYSAGFEHERLWTLDELMACSEAELMTSLLPMDRAVAHLPRQVLTDAQITRLRQGQVLADGFTSSAPLGVVRLYDAREQLIGLGEFDGAQLRVKRLMAI